MDLKQKTKEELEHRLKRLENFIAEKGLGSSYLSRAKRIQRNINLVIFFGAVTTVAGILAWTLLSDDEEED